MKNVTDHWPKDSVDLFVAEVECVIIEERGQAEGKVQLRGKTQRAKGKSSERGGSQQQSR